MVITLAFRRSRFVNWVNHNLFYVLHTTVNKWLPNLCLFVIGSLIKYHDFFLFNQVKQLNWFKRECCKTIFFSFVFKVTETYVFQTMMISFCWERIDGTSSINFQSFVISIQVVWSCTFFEAFQTGLTILNQYRRTHSDHSKITPLKFAWLNFVAWF